MVIHNYIFDSFREDKAEIEKGQKMAIVKMNDAFVSCSCGNVMELAPG